MTEDMNSKNNLAKEYANKFKNKLIEKYSDDCLEDCDSDWNSDFGRSFYNDEDIDLSYKDAEERFKYNFGEIDEIKKTLENYSREYLQEYFGNIYSKKDIEEAYDYAMMRLENEQ